jgi:hypothetical protein
VRPAPSSASRVSPGAAEWLGRRGELYVGRIPPLRRARHGRARCPLLTLGRTGQGRRATAEDGTEAAVSEYAGVAPRRVARRVPIEKVADAGMSMLRRAQHERKYLIDAK